MLSGHKSETSTLWRKKTGGVFSKWILLPNPICSPPNKRTCLKVIWWGTADAQEMLLIKQDGSRARTVGGEKVGVIVSACAFTSRGRVAQRWMLSIQGVFLGTAGRFTTPETDGGTNPTISWLLCVSCPAPICGRAGEQAGGLFVMWYYSMIRHEMRVCFFMNRELGRGNSCMPDQLARRAIVKFFPSPQLFLYGPLKWADASILLPSVASEDYSASLLISPLSLKVSHGL